MESNLQTRLLHTGHWGVSSVLSTCSEGRKKPCRTQWRVLQAEKGLMLSTRAKHQPQTSFSTHYPCPCHHQGAPSYVQSPTWSSPGEFHLWVCLYPHVRYSWNDSRESMCIYLNALKSFATKLKVPILTRQSWQCHRTSSQWSARPESHCGEQSGRRGTHLPGRSNIIRWDFAQEEASSGALTSNMFFLMGAGCESFPIDRVFKWS